MWSKPPARRTAKKEVDNVSELEAVWSELMGRSLVAAFALKLMKLIFIL